MLPYKHQPAVPAWNIDELAYVDAEEAEEEYTGVHRGGSLRPHAVLQIALRRAIRHGKHVPVRRTDKLSADMVAIYNLVAIYNDEFTRERDLPQALVDSHGASRWFTDVNAVRQTVDRAYSEVDLENAAAFHCTLPSSEAADMEETARRVFDDVMRDLGHDPVHCQTMPACHAIRLAEALCQCIGIGQDDGTEQNTYVQVLEQLRDADVRYDEPLVDVYRRVRDKFEREGHESAMCTAFIDAGGLHAPKSRRELRAFVQVSEHLASKLPPILVPSFCDPSLSPTP